MYLFAHYHPQDETVIALGGYQKESEALNELVSRIQTGLEPHAPSKETVLGRLHAVTQLLRQIGVNSKFDVELTFGGDTVRVAGYRDGVTCLSVTAHIFKFDGSAPDHRRNVGVITMGPLQFGDLEFA